MICKKCGTKMEMERDKVYTSLPPQYGFKCPKCGAFEYSTTPEYDDVIGDEAPDAVPPSVSAATWTPEFKIGDHVWAKFPKELAGRTGHIKAIDTLRMMYDVDYDGEIWRICEGGLVLVDPATEEIKEPVFKVDTYTSPIEKTIKAWQQMGEYLRKLHMQCEKEKEQQEPEPSDDALTEDKVYDFYQERSMKAGERADQLAWMFVVMMTGGLISGHAFQAFSVCAALAAVYMLLSVAQAVWQTFTSWLFKQQIKKMDVAPDDYPSWVGGGAWLFFWAKMITISSAVIYFVRAIFF